MGILSPETEVIEPVEVDAPEVETPAVDEAPPEYKDESARETTARVLKELESGKTDAEISAPKEEKGVKTVKPAQDSEDTVDPAQVAKELEIDPELVPPARLDAREQQVFNNLPKTLKRAFSRSIKNLEGMTTREKQELARATQEARGVTEAVQPFAAKWGSQGFTVPSAVAALAAAQERLTNPETGLQTFIAMGKDLGFDLDHVAAVARGEVALPQQQAITQHPEFRQLQQTVTTLQSEREQAQLQAVAAPIAEEMRAVQHEIEPSTGNYRYPELHDDNYLESLKPLVSTLVRTVPNLGYGEALRRAHYSMQGQGASAQTQQTRLPAAQQQNQQTTPGAFQPQRAVSAAVTVRGASAPSVSKGTIGQPPPEALKDARATARWALEQLRAGNNV